MTEHKVNMVMQEAFPVEKIKNLDFGSADGHRDDLIEDTFVKTYSVELFERDSHSLIVGPFGSGKSTIFRLLKMQGEKFPIYLDHLVVSIEEQVSFVALRSLVSSFFKEIDEKRVYQLVWKFHILTRLGEELTKEKDFPKSENEKYINKYLGRVGGKGHYSTIVDKLKLIMTSFAFKFEAKIGETPITLKAQGKNQEELERLSINLDELQDKINSVIGERGYSKATVAIDKLDKFVAGEAYEVQRLYIESLLEVEDDLRSLENIQCKVFIREDLFSRLDFTSLGYDKVQDNTIRLKWTNEESFRFVAIRIAVALRKEGITNIGEIMQSTDFSDYRIGKFDRFAIKYGRSPIASLIIKAIKQVKPIYKEREISLYGKFDRAIITKLFPRTVFHMKESGEREEISIFEYLSTHFLDGNEVCTPRYLLIFLKEVRDISASYYEGNPDKMATLEMNDGDWEWNLFKKGCVEKAYYSSKEKYLRNITSIDDSWRNFIVLLLERKGRKTKFNHKWLNANFEEMTEDVVAEFLAFLHVVGFFRVSHHHADIKKREFELPILYKPTPKEKAV